MYVTCTPLFDHEGVVVTVFGILQDSVLQERPCPTLKHEKRPWSKGILTSRRGTKRLREHILVGMRPVPTNDATSGHDFFVESFWFDKVLLPIPLFFRTPSLHHNFQIGDRLIGRVEGLAAQGTSP